MPVVHGMLKDYVYLAAYIGTISSVFHTGHDIQQSSSVCHASVVLIVVYDMVTLHQCFSNK